MLKVNNNQGSIDHIVGIFKIVANNQNAFPTCACGRASLQAGKLLPKTGRLLPNNIMQKASSEEHWLCMHLSFIIKVQLCLQIIQSCI